MTMIKQILFKFDKFFASSTNQDKTRLELLFFPFKHSAYMQRHRSGILDERIRLFAIFFALLVGIWIVVDLILLPTALALKMVVLRVFSVAGFLYLTRLKDVATTMYSAMWRLVLLIINPFIFYLIALALFNKHALTDDWAILLINIYSLLPFIIVVGLGLFPLTLIESVIFGFASVALMIIGIFFSPHLEWEHNLQLIWILGLLVGITILIAMLQLNYMLTLIHRVSTDPLTKAFTRNSGTELIDIYFHISLEHKTSFSIAFFDLDHFKAINDNYGHDHGDKALKDMVIHLQNYLRQSDMIVRWGGEEFVVIFPGTDINGLEIIMHRILVGWFGQRPEGTPLTASIGYAERLSDNVSDWPELVKLADERMYLAKGRGRARVVGCNEKVLLP